MGGPIYKICRLFVIHGSCTGFQSKNKKTKSVEQKVYWPLVSLLFRMSQSLIKRSELLWKSEKKKTQPICYHWRIDSGCEWLTRVTKDNMMHAGWSIVVSLPCVGDNLGQQQERAMKISVECHVTIILLWLQYTVSAWKPWSKKQQKRKISFCSWVVTLRSV